MTATSRFLTGRRVRVEGFTHRDDTGIIHHDEFLVVGIAPAAAVAGQGDGFIQVQDVIDYDVSIVHENMVRIIG